MHGIIDNCIVAKELFKSASVQNTKMKKAVMVKKWNTWNSVNYHLSTEIRNFLIIRPFKIPLQL